MRPRGGGTAWIILDIAHNFFYWGDLSVARACSLSPNLAHSLPTVHQLSDLQVLLRAGSLKL